MANWRSTINIGDIHKAHENKTMSIQEVGRILADRCRKNKYIAQAIEDDDWDIISAVEDLEEGVTDVEHYDYILSVLYDFGDSVHLIWFEK